MNRKKEEEYSLKYVPINNYPFIGKCVVERRDLAVDLPEDIWVNFNSDEK